MQYIRVCGVLAILGCAVALGVFEQRRLPQNSAQWWIDEAQRLGKESSTRSLVIAEAMQQMVRRRPSAENLRGLYAIEDAIAAREAEGRRTPEARRLKAIMARCTESFYRPLVPILRAFKQEIDARWASVLIATRESPELAAGGGALFKDLVSRYYSQVAGLPAAGCAELDSVLTNPRVASFADEVDQYLFRQNLRYLLDRWEVTIPSRTILPPDRIQLSEARRAVLRTVQQTLTEEAAQSFYRTTQCERQLEYRTLENEADRATLLEWCDALLEGLVSDLIDAAAKPSGAVAPEEIAAAFRAALQKGETLAAADPRLQLNLIRLREETRTAEESAQLPSDVDPLDRDYWRRRLDGASPAQPLEAGRTPLPLHGCDVQGGYRLSTYVAEREDGRTPLHMIGVYEAGPVMEGIGTGRSGELKVLVERPGEVQLALSSYSQVTWIVHTAPGSRITRIFLAGYEPGSRVVGAGDAEIIRVSYQSAPYEWPSLDAKLASEEVEKTAGSAIASFRGCYRSEWFVIGDEDSERALSKGANPADPLGLCRPLLKQSTACLSFQSDGSLQVIGLDSKESCTAQHSVAGEAGSDAASLGWVGDKLYWCVMSRGVGELDLSTGAVDWAPVPCEAVTSDEQGALYVTNQDLEHQIAKYDDFERLKQRRPSMTVPLSLQASRFVVARSKVYAAWHADDKVQVMDLLRPNKTETVPLQGYNDWINGIDVIGGDTLIIAGRKDNGGLQLFDLASGDKKGTIPAPDLMGLRCRSGSTR